MTVIPPESFQSFGDLLTYLRKRARLTQDELSRAVGYSRAHVTRLEKNQRLPDLTTIAALFVPALDLQTETAWTKRLLQLAAQAHGHAASLTITRTVQRTIVAEEIIETPALRPVLPAPMFPLLGRERELEQLTTLLLDPATRLLSLLGPPGVGKTTLALQVAWHSAAHFADGAYWIDLAVIEEPAAVAMAIRQALRLSETTDGEVARVREHLRDRQTLLVLDNFEHLIAAGSVVAELLSAAPFLKVLLTSRAPLRVYGERDFPVSPLPLPDLAQLPAVTDLAQWPSIALFVDRARAVNPAFELTQENALAVAAIVVQLDGLPLAIELAAPQISVMPPQELAARLVNRLAVLTRGPHNRSARQQTLRGAIEWSTQRLTPDQQILFTRLGVFVGGFTAAAVAAVCGSDQLIDLIEVNLVHPAGEIDHTARFTLLETLREYALERLAASGEEPAVREKHAAYFLALAERIEPELVGADQAQWLNRLEKDRDNFRAALTWLLRDDPDPAAIELALQLCVALWKYWRYRCYLNEGYTWTTRALTAARRDPKAHLALRAQAEWGAGVLAAVKRDEASATKHLERSLRLWERTEDARGIAGALTALGARAMYRGDYEQATRYQREALALYESEGELTGLAYAHNALGESLRAAGDYVASREHYQASLHTAQQAGHQRGVALALGNLAPVDIADGQFGAAREHALAALALFREIGDAVNVASSVMSLACVHAALNTPADANKAAQLFGLASQLLRESGGTLEAVDLDEAQRYQAQSRSLLGAADFQTAWQAGQTWASEGALEQLLAE